MQMLLQKINFNKTYIRQNNVLKCFVAFLIIKVFPVLFGNLTFGNHKILKSEIKFEIYQVDFESLYKISVELD